MRDEDDREYHELTETKKQIIEYLARNPGATNRDVAEHVDCPPSYPSRVRHKHREVIVERMEELGHDRSGLEERLGPEQQERTQYWDDLSPTQREVLTRLADEDDPGDPDSSLREIIEDLSFDTYPTYIQDVSIKYIEFAHKLKLAKSIVGPDEDPISLIDEIDTDSINPAEPVGEEFRAVNSDSAILQALHEFIREQKALAEAEIDLYEITQETDGGSTDESSALDEDVP